jgi:hypothetical protein
MAEQSHREEMNAAIRAQRERSAAPKTIAPQQPQAESGATAGAEAAPQPQPEAVRRLFRRRRG